MTWKSEWRTGVGGAVVLAGLWFLPFGNWPLPGPVLAALGMAQDYVREHLLWSLVPALLMAGGLATFMDRTTILEYLGGRSGRCMAYAVASVAGCVLAACSCAVLPLFAGIHRLGAGLGPATTFLFAGPAVNVAAVGLTASVIGPDLALARALSAVVLSVVIGVAMAVLFRRQEAARMTVSLPPNPTPRPLWRSVLLLGTMLGTAIALNWSVSGRLTFTLACCPNPYPQPIEEAPDRLTRSGGRLFYLPADGEANPYPHQPLYHDHIEIQREHVVGESADFLELRTPAGFTARLDKGRIGWIEPPTFHEGVVVGEDLDRLYVRDALGRIQGIERHTIQAIEPVGTSLRQWLHRGRFAVTGLLVVAVVLMLRRWLTGRERREWIESSYDLGKVLLPMLLLGVLVTGFLLGRPDPLDRETLLLPGVLPTNWIVPAVGGNSLGATAVAAIAGAFLYFATLTEVPIVQGLLNAGMGKGPALALLLAGPVLSLPSILMVGGLIGVRKTAVFVALVVGLATMTGWILGPML